MKWKIPLYKIYWDKEDVENVTKTIKQGMFWATGTNIEKFETMIANYLDVKYAVSFNSGTSALHAILLAYNIGNGDEVIVPSFTFISTVNSVLFVGAKPIFADIEEKTYGLNPNDVKKKLSTKTKMVIPVHYGGLSCQIDELKEITDNHNLHLVEDAAESIGGQIFGKKLGSFGDAAMLSFCANKVITTGEGGAVVSDSLEVYEKLKLIRSHGRLETENYFASTSNMDYVSLGYNWRMSNIIASLGVSQLQKVDKIINLRRKKAEYMTSQLSKLNGVIPPAAPEGYYHVYQLYTIRVRGGKEKRDALQRYLNEQGIMAKIYFHPVHLTQFYKKQFGYNGGELSTTETLSDEVLTLPMYPTLTDKEMDYIIKSVKDFLSN